MSIFNVLNLLGGLCLFLFGMSLMGQALERRAGSSLRPLLEKMTQSRLKGLLAGLGVTAVIQSSSATTVMVVGFVNSGLMTLRQSIGVIMGANIGTTVTAWILSLSGIEGNSLLVQMFKPSTFTPILAVIGIVLYLFLKNDKKKDTGMILLGFATLMFGMEAMSAAVSLPAKVTVAVCALPSLSRYLTSMETVEPSVTVPVKVRSWVKAAPPAAVTAAPSRPVTEVAPSAAVMEPSSS